MAFTWPDHCTGCNVYREAITFTRQLCCVLGLFFLLHFNYNSIGDGGGGPGSNNIVLMLVVVAVVAGVVVVVAAVEVVVVVLVLVVVVAVVLVPAVMVVVVIVLVMENTTVVDLKLGQKFSATRLKKIRGLQMLTRRVNSF